MNVTSSELRARARGALRGEYGYALLACLIVTAITGVIAGIGGGSSINISNMDFRELQDLMNGGAGALASETLNIRFSPISGVISLASLLVSLPLSVGLANYFLHLADRNSPALGQLFDPFRSYANVFLGMLLSEVFIFLWSLLFIIPGIIAALRYAMVPYILAEHPELKPKEALELSKKMMKGNCGRLFCLDLSFIGWYLLCCLTLGVGFFFLSPYVYAAKAEFFNEVSGKNVMRDAADGGYDAGGYGQPASDAGYIPREASPCDGPDTTPYPNSQGDAPNN